MHASNPLDTNLFSTAISNDEILVSYHTPDPPLAPPAASQKTTLQVPLKPEYAKLQKVTVDFNNSPTTAYDMGPEYAKWFSECFGWECILAYIGDGHREVLGSISPNPQNENSRRWPSLLNRFVTNLDSTDKPGATYAFPDHGCLLVVNSASLANLHTRLDGSTTMDIRKFRPNIVVEGNSAWEEDFWAELIVRPCSSSHGDDPVVVVLTGNCGRCWSINVDYETGREAKGPEGAILKAMMKDRRVDQGHKYAPVFGRYGYPRDGRGVLRVGDEVVISKRNTDHTKFGESLHQAPCSGRLVGCYEDTAY